MAVAKDLTRALNRHGRSAAAAARRDRLALSASKMRRAPAPGRPPVASHVGNRSHARIDIRLHRRGVRRIVLLFGRGNAGVHVLEGLVLLLHGLVRRVDGRL
jgi:hypothetical protein